MLTYSEMLRATPQELAACEKYIDHMVASIAESRAKGEELTWGQQTFLDEVEAFKATVPRKPTLIQRVRGWIGSAAQG